MEKAVPALGRPLTAEKSDEPASFARKFYVAAWRWHFYAGLFVVPFLLMLSITGLIMVYFNSVETRFGERLYVIPQGEMTSAVAQAQAAAALYPTGAVAQYMPPPAADRSALINVKVDGVSMIVAVDPYTNMVLNAVEKDSTWFYFASDIHGTLLIGDLGDRLIEIAAGLAIVLIVTGLYLWWPRDGSGFARVLIPRLSARGRALWKELHVTLGFYISIVMVFFLISGLAWAGIWGGQFVQAWSTFPAEKWDNVPLSDETHATMNHGALKEVPWGLEQTPLPLSGSEAGVTGIPEGTPVNLTSVEGLARAIGFDKQFRINLPGDATGVYTVSADSMDGDTETPTGDRTVHIDQHSGKVLAEVGFEDYGLAAKAMAVGTALHQGDMGLWNTALNALFCLSVIFLCVSGVVMWWMRRPSGVLRLAAPPLPANLPLWKGAVFIMLLLSLAFPLVGLTLLAVLAFDVLILSNIPPLKRALQ
ncbi:PepSY domain-containing protein [Pelagibius litoralis]|uniref:PepSY domain-containing protein n=1 Tax=Pelagibius litoralis TaxID=374515 RepID=A0A967C426_9PROT|nr:PepSY domain-containing protein [Pelagibius litoralis]NIA67965.1 PepSY domain-containing protein [Pelagibius litoralis]